MRLLCAFFALFLAAPVLAADYTGQAKEGTVILRNFRFNDGKVLPELKLRHLTLGTPRRDRIGRIANAVMVLHGTGGSGKQFLQPQFADELFGPGQPLDLRRYYLILPDNIGHDGSAKPSDGPRMRFPSYNYADMVEAQRGLLDRLGVGRLRLLMGTSMGCMHGFVWGARYPERLRAMMPMACLPVRIAGHNRMWRRAAIDGIKADPAWQGGEYRTQPVQGLRTAVSLLQVAGFAPLYLQKAYATPEAADAYIAERIAKDIPTRDANDLIYQLAASYDYDPSGALERIRVPTTWVNSSDDFINPSDYGIAEKAAARLPNARYVLIKATDETRGHSTHTWARFWKNELADLLRRTESSRAAAPPRRRGSAR
ncbi:MAG: Homoserine O-acetyltransferase [uncultured Sphingomonas sp.]|uniref:Homoserine O-acetyltransferase n=1 Tax=uncultured Sphingomonas sp. TaxID=158754 RepID=A0A6J4SF73_9SPHN|nr:alpha/beta fold hydrolase [uncultured Sphingomonas sp.]CAA9497357.1 MAG: Homoserine O-acetyltransferase [uncultured Sphingomonas sp.]